MDDLIIYHLENSQQFWAELEDILVRGELNKEAAKASLDVYVGFLTKFQDEYFETESELATCCYKLLDSHMYEEYSETILERLIDRAARREDLPELWVTYHMLLLAGKENLKIFKLMISRKKHELFGKLIQHIWELEGNKVQRISIKLLFEICCIQKLSECDLCMIDEPLINYLLDLVEKTRDEQDETYNYSIIKLLLSFNEQFMLANKSQLKNQSGTGVENDDNYITNSVLNVLGARIGSSKTFGENVIFMLNRCVEPHIQMLTLKLLFQIFTSPETFEYFYTNDLMVLVDVFIRELYNLPEESEAIRHTYLRVLHPLLKNTQLCRLRYKQHQIYSLLVDFTGANSKHFKPVSSTTQRLAERCLQVEYLNSIVRSDEAKVIAVTSMENVVDTRSNLEAKSVNRRIILGGA